MFSLSLYEENYGGYIFAGVLFAINVTHIIIYIRGKSKRSNDNEEEDTDWPPEELIFGSSPYHSRIDPKDVVFDDGIVRIKEGAFNRLELWYIELPSSVKYLGERSFYCSKLRKVVLNEVKTIDNEAFYYCKDLEEVLFQEGLQEVGKASFSRCNSLERISFPSSLEKVGEKAFKDCKNLKEVAFSNGCNLRRVGKNAFRNCESLERISITFPQLQYIIKAGYNITMKLVKSLMYNILQNNNIGFATYLAEKILQRY